MHHHDKLVVSLPDAQTRAEVLAELAAHRDVFEDFSGYWCEADEELFERPESDEE